MMQNCIILLAKIRVYPLIYNGFRAGVAIFNFDAILHHFLKGQLFEKYL